MSLRLNSILLILIALLSLGACTVIKSPSSTANFKRVKYHSNIRLAKSQQEKSKEISIGSQSTDSKILFEEKSSNQVKLTPKPFLKIKLNKLPILGAKKVSNEALLLESNYSDNQSIVLSNRHDLSLKPEQLFTNKWWEDDPEDWPWKKIIIFAILFFLVALITYLIVDLVGGVVGGIAGVILLLVLIYFMIDYLGS